ITPSGLYDTKRLASPGQRIVLYANRCEGYTLLRNWRRITVHGFPACLLRRLAGTVAISPPVIGTRRTLRRAQVLISSANELIRLASGQCRIGLPQSRSRRLTGVAAVPNLPAH